jgi:hypothetical protein
MKDNIEEEENEAGSSADARAAFLMHEPSIFNLVLLYNEYTSLEILRIRVLPCVL